MFLKILDWIFYRKWLVDDGESTNPDFKGISLTFRIRGVIQNLDAWVRCPFDDRFKMGAAHWVSQQHLAPLCFNVEILRLVWRTHFPQLAA